MHPLLVALTGFVMSALLVGMIFLTAYFVVECVLGPIMDWFDGD